jgi:hypothetical protein
MKIQGIYEKLKQSSEFQQFMEKPEHKNAYLFLGFFVFNSDFQLETKQLDFFVPETKQIINFIINDNIVVKINEPNPEDKGKSFIDIIKDIDNVIDTHELIEIVKQNIKNIDRIIAILHKQEDKIVFNVNCMSGFNVTNLTIDAKTSQVIKKSDVGLIKQK